MTATRLDLVRHGRVENPQRKVYGRLGEGLSWAEVRTMRHAELDAYLHRPHEVDFVDETFAALGARMAKR